MLPWDPFSRPLVGGSQSLVIRHHHLAVWSTHLVFRWMFLQWEQERSWLTTLPNERLKSQHPSLRFLMVDIFKSRRLSGLANVFNLHLVNFLVGSQERPYPLWLNMPTLQKTQLSVLKLLTPLGSICGAWKRSVHELFIGPFHFARMLVSNQSRQMWRPESEQCWLI